MRTFCDDRAAPSAPVLYFLCAKQMTTIAATAVGKELAAEARAMGTEQGTVITGTRQVPVPVVAMAVVVAVVVVAVTTTLPSATP